MADQRALDALRRIERALARIDAAAERPPPAPQSSDHSSDEYRQLREAHDGLRRKVAGAIGQIDELLETQGRR